MADEPVEDEPEFVELLLDVPVLLLPRDLDDVLLLFLDFVELVLRSLLLELEFVPSVVEPVLGDVELPAPGVPGEVLGEVWLNAKGLSPNARAGTSTNVSLFFMSKLLYFPDVPDVLEDGELFEPLPGLAAE